MPPPTLATRIARIDAIADQSTSLSGTDRLDVATDLVADLLHWCTFHGIDFSVVLRRAQLHFEEEQLEQARSSSGAA